MIASATNAKKECVNTITAVINVPRENTTTNNHVTLVGEDSFFMMVPAILAPLTNFTMTLSAIYVLRVNFR